MQRELADQLVQELTVDVAPYSQAHQVFVNNIPPLAEIPFHIFIGWFKRHGTIAHYNIKRNLRTCLLTYETTEAARAALVLDRSYTDQEGKMMYVKPYHITEYREFFIHIRNSRWNEAYRMLDIDLMLHTRVLSVLAHYYEIIAMHHFELFMLINTLLDEVNRYQQRYPLSDLQVWIDLLLVRREGWFLRKPRILEFVQQLGLFTDDVIRYILIEYLF